MSAKRTRKPSVMHTVGHQTPAVLHAIASGMPTGSGSAKRRKSRGASKKRTSGSTRKRSRGSKKSRAKLVAGSAAAKAWGKKMRAARKKKGG